LLQSIKEFQFVRKNLSLLVVAFDTHNATTYKVHLWPGNKDCHATPTSKFINEGQTDCVKMEKACQDAAGTSCLRARKNNICYPLNGKSFSLGLIEEGRLGVYVNSRY